MVPDTRLTRRDFLRGAFKLMAAAALSGSGVAAYSFAGERFAVRIERVPVILPSLPPELDGMTIAHLSDFHHSRAVPLDYIEKVVGLCNELKPDLVVLTGDYVTGEASFAAPCARVLGNLRAPLGCIATLGNHDHWTDPGVITAALEDAGITVLLNDGVEIRTGLWLLGVDDFWERQDDLPGLWQRLAPRSDAATILLAHEPDFAEVASAYPIGLQLSGHTHGGQIRLPFVGAPILPPHGHRYPIGLARTESLQVYTTRGVGVLDSVPFRLNCPPELTLLSLHSNTAVG